MSSSVPDLEAPILKEWLNHKWLDKENIINLHKEFTISYPFPYVIVDELIQDDKLTEVIEALSDQTFYTKDSDLFQLSQTDDFAKVESDILQEFKQLFRSEMFRDWLGWITANNLVDNVDMLGNIYRDTDYLLCHDDKMPERRLAYIFYLTDLAESHGGSLNLFNTYEGKPRSVVKKIYPRYNRFVCFLVTPISFHEVEEVTEKDIFRVSISGWFND